MRSIDIYTAYPGAGANPSWHGARGGVSQGLEYKDKQKEEAEVPGENPCKHGEHMQTHSSGFQTKNLLAVR